MQGSKLVSRDVFVDSESDHRVKDWIMHEHCNTRQVRTIRWEWRIIPAVPV